MDTQPNVNPTEPSRGGALAGTAAAPPASLAGLIEAYFTAVDAFNRRQCSSAETDAEADAIADATIYPALYAIIDVPARTAQDALAAFDFLIAEGVDLDKEAGEPENFQRVVEFVIQAIRGYLSAAAGGGAQASPPVLDPSRVCR
jgi:hypothetical protein